MIARLVILALVLAPRAAWACATCLSSPYGDRTFNWAFLGLLLMPFVVASSIAGGFACWYYAPHRRFLRFRSSGPALTGAAQLEPHEESSL